MTSVGRLMKPSKRDLDRYLPTLSGTARMRLAHLAAYGVKKHLDEAEKCRVLLTELTKEDTDD